MIGKTAKNGACWGLFSFMYANGNFGFSNLVFPGCGVMILSPRSCNPALSGCGVMFLLPRSSNPVLPGFMHSDTLLFVL